MRNISELMPSIDSLIPYDYQSIKNDSYEKLIAEYIAQLNPSKNPIMIQISRIPGSGKTTYVNNSKDFDGYFNIAFDNVMEMIPDYKKDIKKSGLVTVLDNWMITALIIGYEVLR